MDAVIWWPIMIAVMVGTVFYLASQNPPDAWS